MTEIEQLRDDLATIQKAAEIAKIRGFHELAGNYDQVEGELKQKIAKLEAQADKWERARGCVVYALRHYSHNSNAREIALYARHLEAKVAELDYELRCERIDGGKVRDDQKAFTADRNREKLAELTTIQNALANALPANLEHCATRYLAMDLIDRRIEGVKKEMQGNG